MNTSTHELETISGPRASSPPDQAQPDQSDFKRSSDSDNSE